MKSRSWLALLVLLGTAAGVSAQPPGYGPPPMPYGFGAGPMPQGYGPGSMPYGGGMPVMPSMPRVPEAQPRPAGPPAQRPAAAVPSPDWADLSQGMPKGPAAEASAKLKEGMDKLLAYLSQKEVPNKLQVAAFLDREIAPYFDFDYMARWVAGPGYEEMRADDRKALAARLEADFLGTLASQLIKYEGQQIRLLPPRVGQRGAVSVNVAVLRPGTYPSKLEFRMYKSEPGWRVYDVVADGQSAASYYRVQFQRMAGQGMPLGR
jgi:phospholipid transport system substrate-binding protein